MADNKNELIMRKMRKNDHRCIACEWRTNSYTCREGTDMCSVRDEHSYGYKSGTLVPNTYGRVFAGEKFSIHGDVYVRLHGGYSILEWSIGDYRMGNTRWMVSPLRRWLEDWALNRSYSKYLLFTDMETDMDDGTTCENVICGPVILLTADMFRGNRDLITVNNPLWTITPVGSAVSVNKLNVYVDTNKCLYRMDVDSKLGVRPVVRFDDNTPVVVIRDVL